MFQHTQSGCKLGDACRYAHVSRREAKRLQQQRRRARKSAKRREARRLAAAAARNPGSHASGPTASVTRAHDTESHREPCRDKAPSDSGGAASNDEDDVEMEGLTSSVRRMRVQARVPSSISFGRRRNPWAVDA